MSSRNYQFSAAAWFACAVTLAVHGVLMISKGEHNYGMFVLVAAMPAHLLLGVYCLRIDELQSTGPNGSPSRRCGGHCRHDNTAK